MFDSKYDKPIKILTVLTAVIHLLVGVLVMATKFDFLGVILFLNGAGFFVILVASYHPMKLPLPTSQKMMVKGMSSKVKMLLLVYTIVTIIAYFVVWGASGLQQPIGMVTKMIEVIMVVLLLL